ncbi:hypothetical protein NQ317_011755 [Molorchus minor]|uniref:Uncharacterized protein n=1 Tax=Molorchus minor TaxID=1323400 RepID=A0ABQ9JVA5_9CUCU|nr:hypothetical protein NQ317_011755 [Molorchus minor]
MSSQHSIPPITSTPELIQEENEVKEEHRNSFYNIFSLDETSAITDFVKATIRCIINECLDQLYVLRNINSQNKADYGVPAVHYATLEERYMGSEDHAEYRINSVISSYAKLAKDINTVIYILSETTDEVIDKGTMTLLENASAAFKWMYDEEKQLLDNFKFNKKYLKQLRRLKEDERLENIRTLEATNANIQKLRFEVEDVLVYGKYEAQYFDNWEKTRREQNTIVCRNKENVSGFTISDTSNKIDIENRCHMEMENYIDESKNIFFGNDVRNKEQELLWHWPNENMAQGVVNRAPKTIRDKLRLPLSTFGTTEWLSCMVNHGPGIPPYFTSAELLSSKFLDFRFNQMSDYLDEIQYWMTHYDDETERRETEMINLKADMENLVEEHAALRKKYDAHKAEIDDWLTYRTDKKAREDREKTGTVGRHKNTGLVERYNGQKTLGSLSQEERERQRQDPLRFCPGHRRVLEVYEVKKQFPGVLRIIIFDNPNRIE